MSAFGETMAVVDGCAPDCVPASVLDSEEPLLLRGLVREWPLSAAARESDEAAVAMLKSFYRGKPAPVYYGEAGSRRLAYREDVSGLNFEVRRAPLDAVLEELLSLREASEPPVRYIASNSLEVYFPGLWEQHPLGADGDVGAGLPDPAGQLPGIWIGNRTVSPAHYDAQWNIACCVAGQRKVTVFPPDQVANLYPGPLDPTPGGQAITMVDFASPDFERYPGFEAAAASARVAELAPGDAVYIPCMWWHQFEALAPFNILLNLWWNGFPRQRGQAVEALYHAMLSIRDRPAAEKRAWRALFDYYVFGEDDLAGRHLPVAARGALGEMDEATVRQLRARLLNKLNR